MCGHAGGVDLKTFRKWIWPLICALADLEYTVVSLIMMGTKIFLLFDLTKTNVSFIRSSLRIGRKATKDQIVCCLWMEQISNFHGSAGNFGVTSFRSVVYDMRLALPFKVGIFAG